MTTPQIIAWLDRKMAEHDAKVIPPARVLEATMIEKVTDCFRSAITETVLREARIEDQVRAAMQDLLPPDGDRLGLEVAGWLSKHGDRLWSAFIDLEAERTARGH